jgi:glycosyl hydrolase family 123/concanavalin A-like lectin/glucanase superfamily protein
MINKSQIIKTLLVASAFNSIAGEKQTIAAWSFESLKNNTVKDSSGRHNATGAKKLPEKGLFRKGLYGKAIVMSKGDNMLKVKHNADLNLIDNFTIKCVFNPERVNSYRTLVWKGNRNVTPQRINYYISIHNGKIEFKFKDSKGKWLVFQSRELLEPGKWYQTITTFDNGKIVCYVNGKIEIEAVYKPCRLQPNIYPVYIGAGQSFYGGGIAYPFDGLIDELTIMKGIHTPTAAEINKFNKLNNIYKAWASAKQAAENKKIIDKILAGCNNAKKLTREQLQKMSKQEVNRIIKEHRYRKFFNSLQNRGSIAAVTLNTAERIVSPEQLKNKKLNHDVKLSSAKNEYEGFQVILLGNPDHNINNIRIETGSLASKNGKQIPSDQIEWGYIKSIRSERPMYDVDYIGEIPDVIMEGQADRLSVKAGWFTPVYFRIRVKDSVPAGIYNGKIKIICGNETRNMGVSLKVYDFKLPVTSSLKIIFSFFENFYAKWYGYSSLSDKQKVYIYDFLLKYRVTPNNIYSRGIYPELRFLKNLRKKGANFCTLGYIIKRKKLSKRELDEVIASYRKSIDEIKKAGFEDMAYLYAFDELSIHMKLLPVADQIMTRFKKEFPEIKTIQTSYPAKKTLKYFDVWCPLFSSFSHNTKQIKDYEKAGKEFWWYAADAPLKPYPNFFLDFPVFDNRVIMTLSYKYNVKGVLYWCINREWSTNYDIKGQWPGKRWKPYIISVFSNKRQYKNGMGNYVYPGKDGRILPSLRFENLRDGIEDYEYLMLLKKQIAKAKAQKVNSALIKQAEKLLKVPASVAKSVDNYSSNPDNLLKYRSNIAEMIEKLKK